MSALRPLRHLLGPIWIFSSYFGKTLLFKFLVSNKEYVESKGQLAYPFQLVASYSALAFVAGLFWVILLKKLKFVFTPSMGTYRKRDYLVIASTSLFAELLFAIGISLSSVSLRIAVLIYFGDIFFILYFTHKHHFKLCCFKSRKGGKLVLKYTIPLTIFLLIYLATLTVRYKDGTLGVAPDSQEGNEYNKEKAVSEDYWAGVACLLLSRFLITLRGSIMSRLVIVRNNTDKVENMYNEHLLIGESSFSEGRLEILDRLFGSCMYQTDNFGCSLFETFHINMVCVNLVVFPVSLALSLPIDLFEPINKQLSIKNLITNEGESFNFSCLVPGGDTGNPLVVLMFMSVFQILHPVIHFSTLVLFSHSHHIKKQLFSISLVFGLDMLMVRYQEPSDNRWPSNAIDFILIAETIICILFWLHSQLYLFGSWQKKVDDFNINELKFTDVVEKAALQMYELRKKNKHFEKDYREDGDSDDEGKRPLIAKKHDKNFKWHANLDGQNRDGKDAVQDIYDKKTCFECRLLFSELTQPGDVLTKCVTCPRSYHVSCYTGKIRDIFLLRGIRWQCHRCQTERKPGDPDYEFITAAYKKARKLALANNAALGIQQKTSEDAMDNTQLLQYLDHQENIFRYHVSNDKDLLQHINYEKQKLLDNHNYDYNKRGRGHADDNFKLFAAPGS